MKRTVIALVGFALTVIGLPSISDDIAGWASWLEWMSHGPWQWLVLLLGAGLLLAAEGPTLWRFARRTASSEKVVDAQPVARPTQPRERPEPARKTSDAPASASGPRDRAPVIPLGDAVQASQLRARRLRLLAEARASRARDLREALQAYMGLLLRLRHEDLESSELHAARDEYRQHQRALVDIFGPLRSHFERFVDAEPQYDLRGEMYEPGTGAYYLSPDYPITYWWRPLTLDEAIANWSNVDDDHIRHHLDRQLAVIDAFEAWLAQPRNHQLASTPDGAEREDEEIRELERQHRPRQENERAVQPAATISARQGSRGGGEFFETYAFEAINTGAAVATEVRAWAANDQGECVSNIADLQVVPPDNNWYPFSIEIRPPISRAGGLTLVLAWKDAAGEHEQDIRPIEPVG
jgi:hypothetical protein